MSASQAFAQTKPGSDVGGGWLPGGNDYGDNTGDVTDTTGNTIPTPICGNNMPEVGEQCDGANTTPPNYICINCKLILDACPSDPNKTAPGICGCGVADNDSDGDGAYDCNDACPADVYKTEAGVCGCGVADRDRDSDGTYDCKDLCPTDSLKTDPGACGCNTPETDTDNDGISDCVDSCIASREVCDGADNDCDGLTDEEVTNACGTCGDLGGHSPGDACVTRDAPSCSSSAYACTVSGTIECQTTLGVDTDADGTFDCVDACPDDSQKTEAGICGCGVPDRDVDGDGTANCLDECPADANKSVAGQCGCGVLDTDTDSDGTADCHDVCPDDVNKVAPGACGCGNVDTDTDADGIADCNDSCPSVSNPDQADANTNGVGDACEEAAKPNTPDCTEGQVEACTVSGALGVCADGLRTCVNGGWSDCLGSIKPSREICDGLDNNCDGLADNTRLDQDGDGSNFCDDCDDSDATIFPGAEEVCDGLDNDCDLATVADETCDCIDGATEFFGIDEGECSQGEKECVNGEWSVVYNGVLPAMEICNSLDDDCNGTIDDVADVDGDGVTECENDCNDRDPLVGPQITETCDGVDNNCDGLTDEGFDLDKDGYLSCEDDCDDTDPTAYPGATERFDDADNNCDGTVDEGEICEEGETRPCGSDTGVCAQGIQTCSNNAWGRCGGGTKPAREVCDTFDNDCDGLTDEDFDRDKDGYVSCVDDCNDAAHGINPAATETCDGIDNNCDKQIDEGCDCVDGETQLTGLDVGECSSGLQSCMNGQWTIQTESIAGSIEICDDLDNNCNGAIDEYVTNACGTCGDLPVDCLDGIDDDCDGVDGEDGLNSECLVAIPAPIESPGDTDPELLIDEGDDEDPPPLVFTPGRMGGGGGLSNLSCSLNISMGATSDPISALWGLSGFIGLWFLRRWILC